MKKRVLACGTFDLLHPGHISFLEQAKSLGDELYVCVARDENVARFKAIIPRWDEQTRLAKIQELDLVDEAFLGHSSDFCFPLDLTEPQIIALGYDQNIPPKLNRVIKDRQIQTIRMESYFPELHKSSLLRASI